MPRVRVQTGIELYCEVHGQGPPLLLVHGLGVATWGWFKQVPYLSRHFQVIAFDSRGVGRSDKPDVPYTTRLMAEDALGLLDALGIERAHVMGASLGGYIAQEMALGPPERVDGLVLVCTGPGGPQSVPVGEAFSQTIRRIAGLPPAEFVRGILPLVAGPGYWEQNPQEYDDVLRMRLENFPPAHSYLRQVQAGAAHDAYDRLPDLDIPTLILHGDADQVVPVENARLLAQLIPGAQLALFPGAGHYVFIERAIQLNRTVTDFLQQI